jgi:ribonuclease HII
VAKKNYKKDAAPAEKGLIERDLLVSYRTIVGVDEVGRGCLAGPVVAAAVLLDYAKLYALEGAELNLIRDSKTLSSAQRQRAVQIIERVAMAQTIASASVREIEQIGILKATFLAMRRAITQIEEKQTIGIVAVDGHLKIEALSLPQMAVIKGDSKVFAIAAASIIAKEYRDQLMADYGQKNPGYGFEKHVGYGTAAHLAAIQKLGIHDLHRKNFAPISSYI